MSHGEIGAPSSELFHPLYPDLFHDSITPTVSSNHLDIYPTSVDCNNVHEGDVSQSEYENFESLVHDLSHM